jgi:DNA-directed RNA polymerase subunit N (RpoN/RPB10)
MDVAVPRYPPPRFPHRCVVCGRDRPASTAQLLARVPTGSRYVIDSYSVSVPCCRRHALLLHAHRLGGSLLAWGIAIAALVFVARRASSRAQAGLIGGVAVALMLLVRMAITRWLPLGFDLAASKDSVTFQFADLSLGYEFRALNPPAHDPGGLPLGDRV